MYQQLVEEWLDSLHVMGPRYSNKEIKRHVQDFARWLDERQQVNTCDALHYFLRDNAGHSYCFRCGEKLK